MTTYRARCGALIVRDVTPGPFASVRERLADHLEAQAPPPRNGNVHAATIFHINADRVRLWQEEGAYLASAPLPSSAFVCPGERTCRVCPEHQYSEPQDQR